MDVTCSHYVVTLSTQRAHCAPSCALRAHPNNMAHLSRRSLLFIPPLRKLPFPIKSAPRLAFGELPLPEPVEHDPITGWNKNCRRTGVMAVKLGMTRDWDDIGRVYPLTVLHVCNINSQHVITA
jgi:hypothetical protein